MVKSTVAIGGQLSGNGFCFVGALVDMGEDFQQHNAVVYTPYDQTACDKFPVLFTLTADVCCASTAQQITYHPSKPILTVPGMAHFLPSGMAHHLSMVLP